MEQVYDIYLTGDFTEGTKPETAIAAFARAAGLSSIKAKSLFDNAPSLIKKGVAEATAKAYQAKLQSIGIITRLEAVEATSAAAAPVPSPATAEAHADVQASNPNSRRLVPFVFSGEGYEFFKIWIVNILLVMVTLGIYAPWAKVRTTQYFYGNTNLDGATFAFTADPVKMLIGRLIALALLIAYMVVNALSPIAGIVIGIGLFFLLPWVANRSMAFYARNTTYRNIRFAFEGDYWNAFKTFILWPLAGMLSLMLLMPLAIKKQQEYVINRHRYGNKSFTFDAKTGAFYKLFLIALGIFVVGIIAGSVLGFVLKPLSVVGVMIAYVLSILYFMVGLNNIIFNNSSIAEHNFKANYELKSFSLLMVGNFLLTVITFGLYIPWALVKLANYAANHTQLDVQGDLDKFAAVSQPDPSAFGEEFGDVFDMEVGF
ncbi:DUF898 domain-containing protein [Simiduia sp. 21SJ11W-1]|uniref:YjgN family protein n=1 Tax=Simiduia sp. 21SJ11W-1 TaxID=2909669 RepID=UPI0020A19CA1|nr:DUF898 family protein [Simiduia sp. 21SJ11W-1]UTA47478.1 DUF898 domain-containing protein [Simiduia sp. 21SJ11W-1]